MWPMILRGLLAGAIVVAVSEIARHLPRLAAILLFVPLIPPLVLLAMYLRDGDAAAVSRYARQSLVLIPLGLSFFVPLAIAPALRLSFWPAFAVGVACLVLVIAGWLMFS